MAKKSTKQATVAREKRDLTKFCAFWGIVIAAVLFVLSGILGLLKVTGLIVGIVDLVGKIALVLAVGIPAYDYTKGKKKAWKIVYWVALAIYVLGVVLAVV